MVKKMHYDPKADTLYIVLREGPAEDTVEVDEKKGNIVGIGVWRASRNLLDQLSQTIAARIKAAASSPPQALNTASQHAREPSFKLLRDTQYYRGGAPPGCL